MLALRVLFVKCRKRAQLALQAEDVALRELAPYAAWPLTHL